MRLPKGTYGRIAPRLSLALRHQISDGGGVIDFDFVGEVKVVFLNHFSKPYQVHFSERIAQIIFKKADSPEVVEVDEKR